MPQTWRFVSPFEKQGKMSLSDQFPGRLPRSVNNRFPFRLSVPSFIYPASWVPNIRLLGPYVDEIEILIFDSARKTDLPTLEDIRQMAALADEFDLRYNIHLPSDISPGSPRADCRQRAVEVVIEVVALTELLNPTARVLHLPSDVLATDPAEIHSWRQRIEESVDTIIKSGIPGRSLSIENLNYPMEWIRPVIEAFDLSVCLDVGHLLDRGIDWHSEYRKWKQRINMIHLHGVRNGRDHCALDVLSPSIFSPIMAALTAFTGTVSVEVFSFEALKRSLAYLEKYRPGSV